jgi:hypothetical protein
MMMVIVTVMVMVCNRYGDNDGGDYVPRVRRTRTCEQGIYPLGPRLAQLRAKTRAKKS